MKKKTAFFYSLLLSIVSILITLSVIEFYLRITTYYGKPANDRAEARVLQKVFFEPKTKKRIVILGDSMTYGDGIELADTYPYKLQKRLDDSLPNTYEVINLGIPGTDTGYQAKVLLHGRPKAYSPGYPYAYLKKPAIDLDPDIVILTFCSNDIELLGSAQKRPKDYIILPEGLDKHLKKRYRLYSLLHKRINNLRVKMGLQQSYTQHLQNIYRNETREWLAFKDFLHLIITSLKVRDKKILLVLYSLTGTDGPLYDLYEKVETLGVNRDISTLNLYPYFEDIEIPLRVSDFNGHPNGAANEITAEAIYNKLLSEGII